MSESAALTLSPWKRFTSMCWVSISTTAKLVLLLFPGTAQAVQGYLALADVVFATELPGTSNSMIGAVTGMKKNPDKGNWLSAGDTYAVHLMPAMVPHESAVPADPATHFALQVTDLNKILARLLDAGQKPYQLSLESFEPHYVKDPHDELAYGLGTLFVNDPCGNVCEFVDVKRGIFAKANYKVSS